MSSGRGVHLSSIRFRAHGQDPTDFVGGGGASGAVNLSRIRFRAWEDPVLTSIGGTGGGGGGGGTSAQGSWVLQGQSTGDSFVYYTRSGATNLTSLYASCEVYVSSAQFAAMFPSTGDTTSDFLDLANTSVLAFASTWEGLFFTNKNTSGVVDGNLYVWDYFSAAANKILFPLNTWNTAEIAGKNVGVGSYQFAFGLNGTLRGFSSTFGSLGTLGSFATGAIGTGGTGVVNSWYTDNVKHAEDNWISAGGTVTFSDGFETGDTSAWTAAVGSPTVVATP